MGGRQDKAEAVRFFGLYSLSTEVRLGYTVFARLHRVVGSTIIDKTGGGLSLMTVGVQVPTDLEAGLSSHREQTPCR
jgi:hypothetical protein